MAASQDSQPADPHPSSFLKTWSRIRTVAEYVLDGPRSVNISYDSRDLNHWLEPVLKLRIRRQSPLRVESRSILLTPNCLKDRKTPSLLLRVARWDGESDKQGSKQKIRLDFPSTAVDYYTVSSNKIPVVDIILCAIDEALKHVPFSAEGMSVDVNPSSPLIPTDPMVSSGALILGIWRRTRFQQLEFSWHEVDPNCMPFTHILKENLGKLEDIEMAANSISKDQYFEQYGLGLNPDVLMICLSEEP